MVEGDGCIGETWKKCAKWTVSYPCDEMKLTHHHDLLIVLECAEMMIVSSLRGEEEVFHLQQECFFKT